MGCSAVISAFSFSSHFSSSPTAASPTMDFLIVKLLCLVILLASPSDSGKSKNIKSGGNAFLRNLAKYNSEYASLQRQAGQIEELLGNQLGMAAELKQYDANIKHFLRVECQRATMVYDGRREVKEYRLPIVMGLSALGTVTAYKKSKLKWMDGLSKPNKHFQMLKRALENVANSVAGMKGQNKKEKRKQSALLKRIAGTRRELEGIEKKAELGQGQGVGIKDVLRMGETGMELDNLNSTLMAKFVQIGGIIEQIAGQLTDPGYEQICVQYYLELFELFEREPLVFDNLVGHDPEKKEAVISVIHDPENAVGGKVGLSQLLDQIHSKGAAPLAQFDEKEVLKFYDF